MQNTHRFVILELGKPTRAHAPGDASRATKKLLMQLGVIRVVRSCRLCSWCKKPNRLHQHDVREQYAHQVFRRRRWSPPTLHLVQLLRQLQPVHTKCSIVQMDHRGDRCDLALRFRIECGDRAVT